MSNMSFREKSAWISFALTLSLSLVYFGKVGVAIAANSGPPKPALLFPLLLFVLIALQAAWRTVVALRVPGEAGAPRDERERQIALKARNVSYPVLAVGAFAAIGTVHLGAAKWELMNAVLLAIVIGELTKSGAEILYFRRGV
jgi:hypothetical protein